MNLDAIAPADSGSKNNPRGVPFRFGSLCRGSLATIVPTKVVGLVNRDQWSPHEAHRLVGGLRLSAKRPRRRRRE